jgi:hypothetical protein
MKGKPAYDGRDERGRTTVLPPALRNHKFKKGEVHNPAGRGGEYRRCLMLCRRASYDAAKEIIRLSRESDDDRVRYTASSWVYEYAWGKPKDYDPATEPKPERDRRWDPSKYSLEELDVIRTGLRLMLEDRSGREANRGEEDVEIKSGVR